MADPNSNLPQSQEALQTEIDRVERQLNRIKDQHQHQHHRQPLTTSTTITPKQAPRRGRKRSALSLSLCDSSVPVSSLSPSALSAEISRVESLLSSVYEDNHALSSYAQQFNDEQTLTDEINKLQQQIQQHQQQINLITKTSSSSHKKSRGSVPSSSSSSQLSCVCGTPCSSISDVPVVCCSICSSPYHLSCVTSLFIACDVPLPSATEDADSSSIAAELAATVELRCADHSGVKGEPSVRALTPAEITAAASSCTDEAELEKEIELVSRSIARYHDQLSLSLVARVRNVLNRFNWSQSDVVRCCSFQGGTSAFSCWINGKSVPQKEKKEAVLSKWLEWMESAGTVTPQQMQELRQMQT